MDNKEKPNIMQYFEVVDETMIFTGEKLVVRVPTRYSIYNLLEIKDTVRTLAIFELIVNDTYHYSIIMPAVITMMPSELSKAKIQDVDMSVFTLYNGDLFMMSIDLLQESYISYTMYREFIELGHMPKFLTYDQTANLFDTSKEMTGQDLKTPHVVFEVMYAEQYRDPDNLYTKYRLSDKTKPPVFIGTTNVAFGPESVTSKLIGSRFNDGLNSAIINASDHRYDLEDFLRM